MAVTWVEDFVSVAGRAMRLIKQNVAGVFVDVEVVALGDPTDPTQVQQVTPSTPAVAASGAVVREVRANPLVRYRIADTDTSAVVKYYGFLASNGDWYVMQEDKTNPLIVSYRYAALSNNPAKTGGYGGAGGTKAWVNRAALVYDYLSVLTGL